MYHSGDVARFLPDGNIQIIGRKDSQVKIRGFRIELSEVEEVIRRYEAVSYTHLDVYKRQLSTVRLTKRYFLVIRFFSMFLLYFFSRKRGSLLTFLAIVFLSLIHIYGYKPGGDGWVSIGRHDCIL